MKITNKLFLLSILAATYVSGKSIAPQVDENGYDLKFVTQGGLCGTLSLSIKDNSPTQEVIIKSYWREDEKMIQVGQMQLSKANPIFIAGYDWASSKPTSFYILQVYDSQNKQLKIEDVLAVGYRHNKPCLRGKKANYKNLNMNQASKIGEPSVYRVPKQSAKERKLNEAAIDAFYKIIHDLNIPKFSGNEEVTVSENDKKLLRDAKQEFDTIKKYSTSSELKAFKNDVEDVLNQLHSFVTQIDEKKGSVQYLNQRAKYIIDELEKILDIHLLVDLEKILGIKLHVEKKEDVKKNITDGKD